MHQYGALPPGHLTYPNATRSIVAGQPPASMIRLGVAVRVLGRDGLRARDARRAEHAPHLSISLLYLRELLLYLAEQRIGCYRLVP